MKYIDFETFLKETEFYSDNQVNFFRLFLNKVFNKISPSKVNERSFISQNDDSITLSFIHRMSNLEIKIKVDKYEVYIWVENFGYSIFQITSQEEYSEGFYKDGVDFLKYAFSGNFNQELYYDKDKLVKSRIIWKEGKFPEAIYMPLKYLFLEKLGIKKYKLKTTRSYPSFF